MSNELSTPKVLFCQQDKAHSIATNFTDSFSERNISYFIGLGVSLTNSTAFLSGDGNFLLNNLPANRGVISLGSNAPLAWDAARHSFSEKRGWFRETKISWGNIGLGDGSVQSWRSSELESRLQQTGLATNSFVLP